MSQYDAILTGPIDCPTCGKTMALRNLRYSHACGVKTGPPVEQLAEKAREEATRAHRVRIGAEE